MRIAVTLLFSLFATGLFSQIDCGTICLGQTIEMDAPCTDNYGSTFTYLAVGDATQTSASTFEFFADPAIYAVGEVVEIEICCQCDEGCESCEPFTIEITDGPELSCEFRHSVEPGGPATDSWLADGNQGGCTHRACAGGDLLFRVLVDGAYLGNSTAYTYSYSCPVTNINPTGSSVFLCQACTAADEGACTVTVTEVATGCTAMLDIAIEIKEVDQTGVCPSN